MRPRGLPALMLVVGLVALAASLGALDVRAAPAARLTGDEPHYLLTAISLAEDGDLDVRDEVEAERFRPFHEADLLTQARTLPDGRSVEPHDPLLPLVLAGPIALGGWVGAKVAMALMAAALAALTLWLAVARLGAGAGPAALVVGLFAASAPLAVYGAQIYPELPAALLVTAGVAGLCGRPSTRGLALVGVAAALLPWLAVKYAPLALTLGAVALWRLHRAGRGRALAALGGALAAAALIGVAGHYALYGGLTPYAVGSHFAGGELTVVGDDPDYAGRARRLLGLLVDRDFGIAAWQPAWLLAVPALAALARRRPPGWAAVTLPLAVAWLTATFVALTMQGWWFPGRQVVVALPLAVAAVAWWAGRAAPRLAAVAALGSAGVASLAWLVAEGLGGRVTWVVGIWRTENPLYRAWATALPDYLRVSGLTWTLHGAWICALGVLALRAWRAEARRTSA